MNTTDAFGVLASVLVLAGFSVAIINGGKTASVIGASANGIAKVVRAATLQKG